MGLTDSLRNAANSGSERALGGTLLSAFRDWFLRRTFNFWQSLSVHITPNHFYAPIPDTRTLADRIWTSRLDAPGLVLDEAGQLRRLAGFEEGFGAEYRAFPRAATGNPRDYFVNNRQFESVDGEVLWCMVRGLRPRRVVEVGSGYSTRLIARAALANAGEGHPLDYVVIDPFPSGTLRAGLPGVSRLIAQRVQDVSGSEFDELGQDDILFIDSSHVLKIGSDVQFEYLDLLPRLNLGVVVHAHDIFLPAEYPRSWVMGMKRFWNEQYILQAFLAFNREFQVLWASSFMHLRQPERLEAAFPTYDRDSHWPASFWFQRVADSRAGAIRSDSPARG
jgi:hypothetical protein